MAVVFDGRYTRPRDAFITIASTPASTNGHQASMLARILFSTILVIQMKFDRAGKHLPSTPLEV